jgi:hypothetical protein
MTSRSQATGDRQAIEEAGLDRNGSSRRASRWVRLARQREGPAGATSDRQYDLDKSAGAVRLIETDFGWHISPRLLAVEEVEVIATAPHVSA